MFCGGDASAAVRCGREQRMAYGAALSRRINNRVKSGRQGCMSALARFFKNTRSILLPHSLTLCYAYLIHLCSTLTLTLTLQYIYIDEHISHPPLFTFTLVTIKCQHSQFPSYHRASHRIASHRIATHGSCMCRFRYTNTSTYLPTYLPIYLPISDDTLFRMHCAPL